MKLKQSYRRSVEPGTPTKGRTESLRTLLLSLLAFGLSLGALVRVSALPAEARYQETWYAYSHELTMNYTAHVKRSGIYESQVVAPEQLLRTKLPVEPPVYRRTLVARLTDSIRLELPYKLTGDRPVPLKATYRVDGMLTVPNLWQKPYPLIPPREAEATGTELTLTDMSVEIPVAQLLADMEKLSQELKVTTDQFELRIKPVVDVAMLDLPEPVHTGFAPEFVLSFRNGNLAVDIDEPKTLSDSQNFVTTRVAPVTMNLLGREVEVGRVRQVSLVLLSLLAVALAGSLVLQWLRRRSNRSDDLKRLGGALISATQFELPAEAAVVDVETPQQMIALHVRTDRPVVQAGNTCYLVDGNTCYRLVLKGESE
jgi:hypothetical protein